MAPSEDLAGHVEHEMAVAQRRFRSRIAVLALASVAFDLVAAGLAKAFEHGAQHSFTTYLDALFWTTTQLLTVSSQLPNPEHTATKVLDVRPRGVGDHRGGVARGHLQRPPAPPHAPSRHEGAPDGASRRERAVGSRPMVLGLTAWAASFGLVVVFFVIFPVLVQGLIAFAAAQALGEKAENEEYARHHRMPGLVRPAKMARPVAVVTGAARGIGLETARRLSRHPPRRAVGPRRRRRRAGGRRPRDAVWAGCDITEPASIGAAIEEVVAECGGIDVCISNAGIAASGALRHLDPDVLAAQLNVNLTGNWRFIHACLPHVIARRGYVLGVASLAAIVAPLGIGAYGASKAGLEQLLNVLRIEVRHLGVDVGVAYFSWIDTDMVRGAERSHPGFAAMREGLRGPAGRTLPVGDAADAIVRGVQRRSRRVVAPGFVGALYRLRGLVPELIDREALQVRAGRRPHDRRDGGRARRLRSGPAPRRAVQ